MILQVFEYQKVLIGKGLSLPQWQALVAFAQKNGERYYKILHNGIQLQQYVGVLQVGELTLEVLPKVNEAGDANVQAVLLEMLRECRLLQPETASMAVLRQRKGSLLELYITEFLQGVEQLLREGLLRTYVAEQENRQYYKGKIILHQHLVKNSAHPDRFFTQSFTYSYQHAFNRLIFKALQVLQTLPLHPDLAIYLQQLYQQFPPVEPWNQALPDWEKLRFNRQTLRYKNILQTALLILQQMQPDLSAGRLSVLAILFDMNTLFEEFIFRQLQKVKNVNIIVKRQVPKPFWNRRPIQPDILLTIDNQNIVIDTKWKKLQKVSPTMEDLRQMFVYNQYFNARHSVLVYPQVQGLEDLPPVAFQPTRENAEEYFCQVRLVELVKDEKLNKELGTDLLKRIRLL